MVHAAGACRYIRARTAHAITLQRTLRGATKRRWWTRFHAAVLRLQPWLRMVRWYWWRRRHLAARAFQAQWRGVLPRRRYQRYIGARRFQAVWRGVACRVHGRGRRLPAARVLRARFPLMQDRCRFQRKLRKARAHARAVREARRERRRRREARQLYATVCRVRGAEGRCIVRCFQEGRRLDRVAVVVMEASSCCTATVVVRQDLMHFVLRAAYGHFQQLRYVFNKVSLAHLCKMVRAQSRRVCVRVWGGGLAAASGTDFDNLRAPASQIVLRRNGGRTCAAVDVPPLHGETVRFGSTRLGQMPFLTRLVDENHSVRIEVRCLGEACVHRRLCTASDARLPSCATTTASTGSQPAWPAPTGGAACGCGRHEAGGCGAADGGSGAGARCSRRCPVSLAAAATG